MTGEAHSAEFVLFEICGFSNGFTENPQSFKNLKLCYPLPTASAAGQAVV